MDFGWPGNIRQLENELKRAALLCDAGIEISSLSPEIRGSAPTATAGEQGFGLKEAVREYERRLIESTLEDSRFNVSLAAQKLGIHRVVLHSKMRGLGITRPGRGRKV
jgi:DNA-binding NtrC family response regulator